MRTITSDTWEPAGDAFIRCDAVRENDPSWTGYLHMPWMRAGLLDIGSHVELANLTQLCEGHAIITSIVSASEVEIGGTGAYVDFQGVGTLTIDGEPVEFVPTPLTNAYSLSR